MFDFNQRQNGGILRTHVTIGMFYYRPKGGVASMTFFNISVNNGASRFSFCMYTHLML